MPTSKEFLHHTGDDGKLDMFGFPSVKSNSDLNAFDESHIWPDPIISSAMKHKNDSHWFLDHTDDDNTDVEFVEPRRWGQDPKQPKLRWDEKDDDLLDFLLQDDFQCGEAVPGLESISSFEDPVLLHWTEKGSLCDDEFSNSTDSIYFDEQDVSCDETKLFDPMQASIASAESGSDFPIEQDLESLVEDVCDGISALTTPVVTCEQQSVCSSEEKACSYRAKIASFFAPAKKFMASTEQLCVRPEGEVEIPVPLLIQVPRQELARRFLEVDVVPGPLFVQVPQQEVAHRFLVMQQCITTQEQIDHLSKLQQRLRKLWITSHKTKTKKTKNTSRHDQSTSMASF